jgi:hypothetical protein
MRRFAWLAVLGLILGACTEGDNARRADEQLAGEQLGIYQNGQPVPIYDFSQVRDTLIQINTMLVEGRQSYATIVSPLTGEPLFSCPSVGFPIPADTQLTNPSQVVSTASGAVVEQIEPNGTFTSKNTNATYILCIQEDGSAVPVYSEPPVIASGAALVWDPATKQYQFAGEASMVVQVGR